MNLARPALAGALLLGIAALPAPTAAGGEPPIFTDYCFGTAQACPCGNAGGPNTGCLNSFSQGGRLVASGNPSVADDTVVLAASGLPTTATILFFQGTLQENGGLGVVFGDGLRCAGGSTWRMGTRIASSGLAAIGAGIPGDPSIAARGMLPPEGATMNYQGWYRNAASYCTPDGFNLTNGITIVWGP